MEKSIKIPLVVLMLMVIGEAKEDLELIVKDMRMKMVDFEDHISITEEKLLSSQRQLMPIQTQQLKTDNEVLHIMEFLNSHEVSIKELERSVSFLKNPPSTFSCGYHTGYEYFVSNVISYTSLSYSSSNVEGSGLDISSGIFTSGHPGTYTATWSLASINDAGDHYVQIHLRKNGSMIQESRHVSYYTGSSGKTDDQGGRTLILHLERGDTLDLYCDNCSAGVYDTTFCVSLSQFDVE